MENNNENADSSIGNDQDVNLDLDLDTASPEDIKAAYLATQEKNKQLYARAKKAESGKAEATEVLRKAVQAKTEPQNINNTDGQFEKLELIARGYSDDEIDFVLRNGGKKGLENPFVKSALDSLRTQRKAEQASELESSSSKSDISKRYTDEQLSKMSVSQLEKILSQG